MVTPEPSLGAFYSHFESLFGGASAAVLSSSLHSAIEAAQHAPITPQEVASAATAMKANKTTALATFGIELLRGHSD